MKKSRDLWLPIMDNLGHEFQINLHGVYIALLLHRCTTKYQPLGVELSLRQKYNFELCCRR